MHAPGQDPAGVGCRGQSGSECRVCGESMNAGELPDHIANEHGDGGDDG